MDIVRETATAASPPEGQVRPLPVPAAAGPAPDLPSADEAEAAAHGFPADRLAHAWEAQFTAGLSPAALLEAFSDWAIHLANAPGKQADLVRRGFRKWLRFAYYGFRAPFAPNTPPAIQPLPGDRRFAAADWQALP